MNSQYFLWHLRLISLFFIGCFATTTIMRKDDIKHLCHYLVRKTHILKRIPSNSHTTFIISLAENVSLFPVSQRNTTEILMHANALTKHLAIIPLLLKKRKEWKEHIFFIAFIFAKEWDKFTEQIYDFISCYHVKFNRMKLSEMHYMPDDQTN